MKRLADAVAKGTRFEWSSRRAGGLVLQEAMSEVSELLVVNYIREACQPGGRRQREEGVNGKVPENAAVKYWLF